MKRIVFSLLMVLLLAVTSSQALATDWIVLGGSVAVSDMFGNPMPPPVELQPGEPGLLLENVYQVSGTIFAPASFLGLPLEIFTAETVSNEPRIFAPPTVNLTTMTADLSALSVQLGGVEMNAGGLAKVTDLGDRYRLTWGGTILFGPFPGFNFAWTMDIMPDNLPRLAVAVNVANGPNQECNSHGGNEVVMEATVLQENGAELDAIIWTIDGEYAGSGDSLTWFFDLGQHEVEVTATATNASSASASVTIKISDTTAPELTVAFVNAHTGEPVTTIGYVNADQLMADIRATDVCDPEPVIEATGGFAVAPGDLLKVKGNKDQVTLYTSAIEIAATAIDASGQKAYQKAILTFAE